MVGQALRRVRALRGSFRLLEKLESRKVCLIINNTNSQDTVHWSRRIRSECLRLKKWQIFELLSSSSCCSKGWMLVSIELSDTTFTGKGYCDAIRDSDRSLLQYLFSIDSSAALKIPLSRKSQTSSTGCYRKVPTLLLTYETI